MREVVKIIIVGVFSFLFSHNLSWANSDTAAVVRMDKKELKAETDTIKARKLSYADFKNNYSINDTTETIINIFFDKQSNSAIGQMSFLPIAVALVIIPPPIRIIGMGLTIIAFPLFLNGAYTMYKFRRKKLLKVLVEYKKTGYLPSWIRKKAANQLDYLDSLKIDY